MIAAVSRLQTMIEPLRREIDSERKLPAEIVDPMRREGLLALLLPTEYGGPQIAEARVPRITAMVARNDLSRRRQSVGKDPDPGKDTRPELTDTRD